MQEQFSSKYKDEPTDWVLIIQMYKYCTGDGMRDLSHDIADACIFRHKTAQQIEKICSTITGGCRCIWDAVPYDVALMKYEKEIYVDPVTKTEKWGNRLKTIYDVIEALNQNKKVAMKLKDDDWISYPTKKDFANSVPTECIMNVDWYREVLPVQNIYSNLIGGI